MSFILDALKKSENERQRQVGPALYEVKVAPPKPRWPAWAFALAGLLIINIGVVAWLMLRAGSRGDAVAAPVVQAPVVAVPMAPISPPAAAVAVEPPPPAQPLEVPATAAVDADVLAEELNAEDFVPAVEPPVNEPRVTRGTVEGLPTYDQVAGTAGMPDLRLDLHVYAAKPQERFIFLNMRRLREGDALPEGVRVDSITPDGTLLSFRGTKFVLERE